MNTLNQPIIILPESSRVQICNMADIYIAAEIFPTDFKNYLALNEYFYCGED